MFVIMDFVICYSKMWIKFDHDPSMPLQIEDTTVGVVVKKAYPDVTLDQMVLRHNNTRVSPLREIFETTENNPLHVITKLTVWYKSNNDEVDSKVIRPPNVTVKKVLESALKFKELNKYIVKFKDSAVEIEDYMVDIDTSRTFPLVINRYMVSVMTYSKPSPIHCSPYDLVIEIARAINIAGDILAFHDGKKIECDLQVRKLGEISQEKPLVFRSPKVKVSIEGGPMKEIKIDNHDNIDAVKYKLGTSDPSGYLENKNGREVTDLDKFIFQTADHDRCLYYRSHSPLIPKYTHSLSVSDAAKNKPIQINKFSKDYELNTNWLSICMYNEFCSAPEEDDKKFSETFTEMMDLLNRQDPKVLSNEEYVYSAMFFRALDRFLFPNNGDRGCVLHQPSLETRDRPDGYIATLKGNLPSVPILTSDFKKENEDFERATTESIGYFQSIICSGKKSFPVLVMPCTRQTLSLYLCWPIDNHNHATIKICEAQKEKFSNFFHALRFAVEHLIINKESLVGTKFKVMPVKELELQGRLVENRCVYERNGYVYKLFNTQTRPWAVPNEDIIKGALGDDYLPEIQVVELTKDNSCKYLKYKYIDNDKKCLTFTDFEPIMDTLDKLHAFGYVHSDVRLQNMLFPSNGHDKAKLIDFDLTAKPGVRYPDGYNQFKERHTNAKAGEERQFIHDRYSLHYIIKSQVDLTTDEQNRCDLWSHIY